VAGRLKSLKDGLPVAIAAITLVLVWQYGAALFDVPTYILPRPFEIAATIVGNLDLLGSSLVTTMGEALAGFALGAVLGLAVAIIMVLEPVVEAGLMPLAVALNSVPLVAFVPLSLIWFGLGPGSKIAMGAFSVSFAVLFNGLSGLKRADGDAINLLKSFGAGRLGILRQLQLPTALPSIVTGLRVGWARSTIVVIVAEMLGAYSGLGQIIYQSTSQVDYLSVWAAVVVAAVGSLVLYGVLVAIDQKLVWWR
jgi:NitT/TauT family transport system permease protein